MIFSGCGEEEADRDRGAGDQEEGEGADGHGQAPRRGRGLQGPNCRRGNEVSQLSNILARDVTTNIHPRSVTQRLCEAKFFNQIP